MASGVSKTTKKSAVASKDLRSFFGPGNKDAPALSVRHANTTANPEDITSGRQNVSTNTAVGMPGSENTNSLTTLQRSLILPVKSNIGDADSEAPHPHTRQQRRRGPRAKTKSSKAPAVSLVLPADGVNTVVPEALHTDAEVPAPLLKVPEPTPVSIHAERRLSQHFVRHTERFERISQAPWRQYREIYASRLETLRNPVLLQAHTLWDVQLPPGSFLARLQDAKAQAAGSPDYVVIGVLYKEFAHRPKVVGCCPTGDTSPVLHTVGGNLCSDADVLWLEDDSQRLCLSLAPHHVAHFVTGLVAAVRGRRDAAGAFLVTDLTLARLPMPVKIPAMRSMDNPTGQGPFIAFVSGLNIGASQGNSHALDWATNFLLGHSDASAEKQLSMSVQLLIVCGGTFAENSALAALDDVDKLLSDLGAVVSVDLMPGPHDPTNFSLPQMPLSPHLFKRARRCQDVKAVTNPYECSLDSLRCLGHAGQPVEDLMRCSKVGSPLAALELSLKAMHLAPTAPDTLASPPLTDSDPFIMTEIPHVLFSGGHDAAAHRWHGAPCGGTGTLCLCVPAFHRSPAIVLVSMRDPRDVRTIRFNAHGL